MIIKICLVVVILLVLFILLIGLYVFLSACMRRKERPWLDFDALRKTPYGKYEELIRCSDQFLKDHNAKDVYVKSCDGLKLHGLWVPVENAKGTILMAHGYRSTYMVDFGKALKMYHELGFNLLLPQQRACGQSEGRIITFGVKESRDMLKWLEMHNKTFGYHQVILSGMSMGASTMMYLMDKKLPENVKGVIVDCGFTSPAEIISKVITDRTKLPAVPFIWIADLWARILGQFSFYACDSKKILPHNKLPIIMVHGKEDHFVPCYMTEEGFRCCNGNKQLLLADGAGHGLSFIYATAEYTQMIEKFLKDNIKE